MITLDYKMRNKIEVNVWDHPIEREYYRFQVYRGNSLIKAIYKFLKAKQAGWKRIRIEWRPD